MKLRILGAIAAAAATLALAAGAAASMMHPTLGAHLSGMGEHGIVNLRVTSRAGRICWTFEVPSATAATSAAIHAGRLGPTLLALGMHFERSGCEKESAMTLERLEARPGRYWVWVNTRAHRGDLRGALAVGMAHM